MRKLMTLTALVGLAVAPMAAPAQAGCVGGAVVGGIAGHMLGHGVAGAAAGCAVGHHRAHVRAERADRNNADYQNQNGYGGNRSDSDGGYRQPNRY